jgi:malate dehydrogenase (oxaloacetate-decarboxylating)
LLQEALKNFISISIEADEKLREDYVIPDAFGLRVASRVAEAVSKAAIETKVIRK